MGWFLRQPEVCPSPSHPFVQYETSSSSNVHLLSLQPTITTSFFFNSNASESFTATSDANSMTPTPASVSSFCLCFSGRGLTSAIAFEAERGYRNAFGTKMRFNNFLLSKIPSICYRSKHKFAENLLEEVQKYDVARISDRSKLLNKVSVLIGYNSLHDLIESERSDKGPDRSHKDSTDEFDPSMACKRFPSIILGSSPPIELYDEGTDDSDFRNLLEVQRLLSSSMDENWSPLDTSMPNLTSSKVLEEKRVDVPQSSVSVGLASEYISDNYLSAGKCCSIEEIGSRSEAAPVELILDRPIRCIAGLRKRQCQLLEKSGFHTLRKLLHHFPRTYADLQNMQVNINDGQYMIFVGEIMSSRGIRASYSFSFLEVIVSCEVPDTPANCGSLESKGNSSNWVASSSSSQPSKTIYLHLKKFFRGARFTCQPFLRSLQEKHQLGEYVCVSGKVRKMSTKNHYEMREYRIDVLKDGDDSHLLTKERPYPIYPSKGGSNSNLLQDIVARALQSLSGNIDPIPTEITQAFGLPRLHDAYYGIHLPKSMDDADLARKRLIFDEFFYMQLGRLFQMLEGLGSQIERKGLLNKYLKPEINAAYLEKWSNLTKKFLDVLPYSLTSSQLTAASEIIWDLQRPVPMNRLLQGEVGCGKTVVAFLACMEVVGSGYQAAFMVPTELLAIQHYEHLFNLLEKMEQTENKPSIALLTGSTPSKQARMIREGLQAGNISIVIGTHSLIADRVEFSSLRIAVVDEQHRFGVIQRGRFNSKLYQSSMISKMEAAASEGSPNDEMHMAPHVLALSATPIPRTLALALYGDISLTQITGMPPGRLPVETHTIEGSSDGFEKVYRMILDELKGGGKVYIVYPVIEQSEQLPQLRAASADLDFISNRFEGYSCGLLHGRMKGVEKEEVFRRFRSGEIHILLSTQVIEIGVDIPDASMMVVMNAERFGIAQLHQLRGRVGRGERRSKCLLIASSPGGADRLQVLEKSSNGFHLANVDLLIRGPGDLLGKKQSGHLPEFPIARLEADGNILQDAHVAALKILSESHDLAQFPALKAELSMRQPLCVLGD